MGVAYYSDPDDFCEQHPDVVVLCSSIVSTRKVINALNIQRLRRNTLFVDVLSVKVHSFLCLETFLYLSVRVTKRGNELLASSLRRQVFPKELMLQELPEYFDILCTHPM